MILTIVKLRGGQCIGQAEPIVEVLAEPKSDKIRQSTISTDNHNNEDLTPI